MDDVETIIRKLLAYCQANDWAGYDPYDALNSKVLQALPFLNARLPRLVFTQVLKRSPINIRGLMLTPKTQNPKAIGLFLSAFLKLSRTGVIRRQSELMIERLISLRSKGVPYWCWGYSFPWQNRTSIVPSGTPNLVCTTFVADALLDAYAELHDPRCLDMAMSACEYLLNDLYWTDGCSVAGFCYPLRSRRSLCHNANFLAAALLCRVYRHTGEQKLLDAALRVARYSAGRQRAEGSWLYGEELHQGWIDNFHTGYNLCALQSISRDADTAEFDHCIERGFAFYRDHFFREDGAPRYYHNRTYPIDVHSAAQSIITLLTFRDVDSGNRMLAHSVFRWALKHMWDDQGFFYYRVLRFCTIRTSYMRWSQAWMLLALVRLMEDSRCGVNDGKATQSAGDAAQTA